MKCYNSKRILLHLLLLQLPKIEANRPGMWATDLEFGRQVLAGMNPCMFEVMKEMPAARGSAIGPQHVDGKGGGQGWAGETAGRAGGGKGERECHWTTTCGW